MGKAELMQEKIARQRQLPDEIKEKLNNTTFVNLLISIALMVYIIVVNLLFMNESTEIFTNATKASAFTFAIIDIILFEIVYRKENLNLAIHAIELLCVSLFALAIPYIYLYFNEKIRNIIMISPVFLSIYYVGKTIVIHIIEKNKYLNNLSDVQELLQDNSENPSYLEDIDEDENLDVDSEQLVTNVQNLKQQVNLEKEKIKEAKKEAKKEKDND